MTLYAPSTIQNEIKFSHLTPVSSGYDRKAKKLQEWLNFHQCRTRIDGIFGPATAFALDKFREEKNISSNGPLDQLTWDALVKPMSDAMKLPEAPFADLKSAVGAIAKQHLDAHPIEIGGQNRGPWVRAYMRGHDGTDYPWCAGFVSFVLAHAAHCTGHPLAFDYTYSCDTMVEDARDANKFLGTSHDHQFPLVFAKRKTPTDWTHVGFCLSWRNKNVFMTVEGNSNDQGLREGFEVAEISRNADSGYYDFIRI